MPLPEKVERWRPLVRTVIGHLSPKMVTPPSETLILGLIWQESSGDNMATRKEPGYRWLWDLALERPYRKLLKAEISSWDKAPAGFPGGDEEWQKQRTSWGLMQVMGATARERGLGTDFETLLVPEIGLTFGTKHLYWCLRRESGDEYRALTRYNAGTPFATKGKMYAASVLSKRIQG